MLSLAGAVREVVAYATTTAAYPGFPERIELIGANGTAILAGTALDLFWHDERHEHVLPELGPGGTGVDPMAFPNDWHRALIADFVAAIAEGRPPLVSGAEALKVHRLIDALLRAAATRQPVALSDAWSAPKRDGIARVNESGFARL